MISYNIPCFICKHHFEVNEKSPQYQQIKRNFQGRHICPDCTELIEKDAQRASGLNRAMLEELDAIALDRAINSP
jgi:uncharacterized protein YlaI